MDDEPDLVYLFKDALSEIESIEPFAFTNPVIALEHFRLNHKDYAAVISDFRMPEMNGDDLLNKIKQINQTVTRIMISAFDVGDSIFKDCECIDKFLQKPVKIRDLIHEVQKSISIESRYTKSPQIF